MRFTGLSIRSIATRLQIPKSTINEWIQTGRTSTLHRSGRPKLINERDQRRLKRFIKKNRKTRRLSPLAIIEEMNLNISESTLIRELNHLNIFRRIARRRPYLTQIQRQKRLVYAKQFKHWTIEDWKRVIWTDETTIRIGMNKMGIDWVWREPGEEFHKDCIDPTKRDAQGYMFWGAFHWNKIGPGLFFQTDMGHRITSQVYHDQILSGPLYDFWAESFLDVTENGGPIIIEDGAPVHKGVCVKARQELGIIPHPHPPNSPDLNPIEEIWRHLKYYLATQHPTISTKKQLQQIVTHYWEHMADNLFNSLVESMPDRIQAVIKAKGGSTLY